jgi:predicted transcriptional regulator
MYVIDIPVKVGNYNKAILNILNCMLGLSNFELSLLKVMLDNGVYELTNDVRHLIIKSLDKDKYTVNNYISKLGKKGILVKGENKVLTINPKITSVIGSNSIKFNLHVRDN